MDVKILFSDLDETLLRSDKTVSPTDLQSIDAMIEKGHRFVVATGRPFFSAYKLCKELGFVKPGFYIIASNGSIIYDCTYEKMLLRNSVPFEHVAHIFDAARKANIHIQTYTDEYVVAERATDEIISYSNRIKMPYKILNRIPDDLPYEPPKMIAISPQGRAALVPFRDSLAEYTKDKLNTVFSLETLLEFLPLTSSKGNAIIQLCEILDIPVANSIACGDEENDISMLDAAGIGVVMQNGTDTTKAHADYITTHTNNENAITEVINKFIL